jgi:haloalkane dehalogenase
MTTLPDFPFAPHFVDIDGHQISYVEVGEGAPMLFVHGNPTSSYTFRHVLAPIAEATGRRCIAIDLLGFGRSDKPNIAYSCGLHADILEGFIDALDLRDIILVAEDWGGFLGGYVMTRRPERFEAAVLMETFLWPMTWADDFDPNFRLPFKLMRSPIGDVFSRGMNVMINKLIPEHCPISEESLQVYRDAVPTWRAKKALADFPKLIPIDGAPAASHRFALELQEGLSRLTLPVAWLLAHPGVMISDVNPIGRGRLDALGEQLPQLEVLDFGPGYHFLSEESPERVVELVSSWVNALHGVDAPKLVEVA